MKITEIGKHSLIKMYGVSLLVMWYGYLAFMGYVLGLYSIIK
jgi:hypothetical protein